jgi:Fur family ferric uptake transcriptional regulator
MKHCHQWGQTLKGRGFRLTVAREAIIHVLERTDAHVSAEDIYMAVHPEYPAIGLTTIYRTLDLLQQTGIISKFEFGHGRAKFELSEKYSSKKHHHHLICRRCRKIIDYSDFINEEIDYIQKTEEGLKKKYNFDISDHEINFYGLCEACKG